MTVDRPLWTAEALVGATGGRVDGAFAPAVRGVSIDTRTIEPGDLFVPLKAARDGHEFVPAAFAKGAAAALVAGHYERQLGDGALIVVDDPLAALERLAAVRRRETGARIVAVTGSVGKTGTKEMLRRVLAVLGPTHAPEKSYNNHWGVPLTLARMPAESRYGVFEIGMNHAGEITPLTRLVRPHVAIVTTVEAVHIENFAGVEGIAEAKAEIFRGLGPDGLAVINRDNSWHALLARRAAETGARIVTFGRDPAADLHALVVAGDPTGTDVTATYAGRRYVWRLGAPGDHIAQNSLAVCAALLGLGLPPEAVDSALAALATMGAPAGRGQRTWIRVPAGEILLVDESYNANPTSVRAALAALALVPRITCPRRIAVLGDMLELGAEAALLHEGLIDAVDAAAVDLIFAAGPHMRRLFERVPPARRGMWAQTSAELEPALVAALRGGDAVMIKGSLGSRMGPLVEAVRRLGAG